MTEAIHTSLRDKKSARWIALLIVAFTMFGAYFFNYALSPVKPMLESILGWNSADFGTYTSSYTWFNVFLFMLIFSGMILDKFGIRFTGLLATSLMVVGTGLNYWAIITVFPEGSTVFGIKTQVLLSAVGFGIFGVGTEAGGITVTKAIVKWFKGYEMALAMGMQMSIARLGTALALGICLPMAKTFNYASPVLFAFILMLISLGAFVIYTFLDKKLDESEKKNQKTEEEEEFQFSDILSIIKNRGFWYIAILCVLFYGAVFPFLFYATDLMINKYNVNPNLAGLIPSLLPFGTIFLTPVFGGLYDKKGKGATIMIIGAVMLIFVHGVLTVPFLNFWLLAVAMVIVLGIAFSLVPAAMWPSVPKIIPEKQLGTAYAVIFWIQNIGLWLIPLSLGIILNSTNPAVVPNKALITDSISKAFNTVAPEYNLDKSEIKSLTSTASTAIIDNIVQTTNYKAAEDESVNKEVLADNIVKISVNTLQQIEATEDMDKLEETTSQALLKTIRPLVVEQKLNIRYDYFYDLLLFTILGISSLVVAFLLKKEDKQKGYGLELPNIVDER